VVGVRHVEAPSTPTVAITTATSITVSWTDLSTIGTGFIVERQITPVGGVAGDWVPHGAVGSTVTVPRTAALVTASNATVGYVDARVAPDVQGTREYRVRAVNQTGTATNASSALVHAKPPNSIAPSRPLPVRQLLAEAPAVAKPCPLGLHRIWTTRPPCRGPEASLC
jgi:hypothetical protein